MKKKRDDIVLYDEIIIDIHETNRRLLQSQYVQSVNYNQIRQLLSGNKKSQMYGRIDHLHKDLWGKYPEITEEEVKVAIEKYVVTNPPLIVNHSKRVLIHSDPYVPPVKNDKTEPPNEEMERIMDILNDVNYGGPDNFNPPMNPSIERPVKEDKYELFCNVANAKKFTLDDLNALANWDVIPDEIKDNDVKITLPIDEVDVPFYSIPEYNTYIALRTKKLIRDFRVQSLEITYSTYQGKFKPYYPDFVFLTPEGYIAIVESKPVVDMSNFYNRCKYYALKLYCESMGFIYAMVDENLVSLESILQRKVNNGITKAFDEILETTGQFSAGDLKFIFDKHKSYTQIEVRKILSKHITQKNLINTSRYGFEISSKETIDFDRL